MQIKQNGRNRGFSIVQVVVALGLMAIGMMAFITMQTTQMRGTTALSQKLEWLELKNFLISIMADGKICQFEINSPVVKTFDSRPSGVGRSVIRISKIHTQASSNAKVAIEEGQYVSGSKNLFVKEIKVMDFTPLGGNMFSGQWLIDIDHDRLVQTLRPLTLAAVFTVDASDAANTKITGCFIKGWAFNAPACPAGMWPLAVVPRGSGDNIYTQVWCRGPFGPNTTVGGSYGGTCPAGSTLVSCQGTGYGRNWTWSQTANGCTSSEGSRNYGSPGCSCVCAPPIVDKWTLPDGTWGDKPAL